MLFGDLPNVLSMTGIGQARGANASYEISVVLRSVNHRFLDLKLRLEETFLTSEAPLRELLSSALVRGRVDVRVEIRPLDGSEGRLVVRREMLRTLHHALEGLEQEGLLASSRLQAGDLLRLPQVLELDPGGSEWSPADHALLLDVAGRALNQLVEARRTEGQKLEAVLDEKLELLRQRIRQLEEQRVRAVEEMRTALERRLAELLARVEELDPGRLEQEIALLVDRSDVSEELDRLSSHLDHFEKLMAETGSVGKRLDFLTQEIFRELNTIGSKCRHSPMTRMVLDSKSLCEQLREQVQNLE
ncbi:MAG: YicC/YloC family endoribonuclease [Acidobacteriota bacterium]